MAEMMKIPAFLSQSALAHSFEVNEMPAAMLSHSLSRHTPIQSRRIVLVPSKVGFCELAPSKNGKGKDWYAYQRSVLRSRCPKVVMQLSANVISDTQKGNGAAFAQVAADDGLGISGNELQTAEQESSSVAERSGFDSEPGEGFEDKHTLFFEETNWRDRIDGSLIENSAIDKELLKMNEDENFAIDKELPKMNLHSKCTSVILALKAYEYAEKQLLQVSKTLDQLSHVHCQEEKIKDEEDRSSLLENVREIENLKLQVTLLEQELDHKNETLQFLLKASDRADKPPTTSETTFTEDKAESSDSLELTDLDKLLSKYMRNEDIKPELQKTLAKAENKASILHRDVKHLHNSIAGWKFSLNLFEEEGKLSSHALEIAAQELNYAKVYIVKLTSRLNDLTQELEMSNAETQATKEELDTTRKDLTATLQSLSTLEVEASSQNNLLLSLEEALRDEKEASAAALRSSTMHQKAFEDAKNNISELKSQVMNFKELLKEKEEHLLKTQEEAKANANALLVVTQKEEALASAEKKIKQLAAQVGAMKEEIRSRDLLLNEIKENAVQTTEALKIATQIKQDLNLSKQREFRLSEELESKTELVNELRQEMKENERASLAEQALRQREKEMNELQAEADLLRKGVHARDEALKVMKDEIDRNIGVLSYAAENRELMQKLQVHIRELEAELSRKDALLKLKEKKQELESSTSGHHVGSSEANNLPPSVATPSASFETPKSKKRNQRKNKGSSKGSAISQDSSVQAE